MINQKYQQRGQAALEYMLLLTVVAVVILLALKPTVSRSLLNRAQTDTEGYYNTVTEVIMGKNPLPIDGGWCAPKPNGVRECACPQPAFGGAFCTGSGSGSSTPIAAYCGDGTCNGNETGEAGHPSGPGDTQQTCLNDCDFVDCGGCATVESENLCGAVCGTVICTGLEVCMSSKCAATCPGYQARCQQDTGLCSGSCSCDPATWTPSGACGVAVGSCSPTPFERCSTNANCDSSCTPEQKIQPRPHPTCGQCAAVSVPIPCGPGTITFPLSPNDPTRTVSVPCPAGCSGGPMTTICSNGAFTPASNFCN
ncbi:MAG: hypothetical protein JNN05_02335 [Candidatus Omnitrophica bacterium]|nr:hypothetical protein [Candidatus Omnitrophota bacterium]